MADRTDDMNLVTGTARMTVETVSGRIPRRGMVSFLVLCLEDLLQINLLS